VAAMKDVLEVYGRPFDPARPVVCLDGAWDELTVRVQHEAVTFVGRCLERAWQRRILGYGALVAPFTF
jgi:hypothetical protein